MKLTALFVTVLLALSICAFAQGGGGGGGGARQDRVGPAVAGLGLSEAQITSLRDISTKFRTDSRAIMQETGTDAEKQTKVDALKATATTAIKDVLKAVTPAIEAAKQDEVVTALLASRGRGGAPGGGAPTTGAPGARNNRGGFGGFGIMGLMAQLDLTPEQQTKIDEINKANQAKLLEDINKELTEAQRTKLKEINVPRAPRPTTP
ncbi:MAG: hypothetical protein NT018_06915 [Armatimonadetes bacterium]|nr:hypothetical protein [Armatimonadota bacterium]